MPFTVLSLARVLIMHICTMLRAPLEYSYDINFIECDEETAIQKRKEVLYQSYCDLVSYCMCIVYRACMSVTYICTHTRPTSCVPHFISLFYFYQFSQLQKDKKTSLARGAAV